MMNRLPLDYDFEDGSVRLDIPGPYTLEWSASTARNRIQRKRAISREAIPVGTGIALAGAYDVAGLAIMFLAPPIFRPIGAAMLAPGPSEAILFAVGYHWGTQIQDEIPDWML